jgi:hypothetical protein
MRNTARPNQIGRSRQASRAAGTSKPAKKLRGVSMSSNASYVIISDVSSAAPVTEPEIQLVLGALGAGIASIFAEDE